MLKGVHLSLLIGPVVPIPVPQSVIEALTEIEVSSGENGAGGFQLKFRMDKRSPLQILFLLTGGNPIPLLRVVIVVTLNGTPDVIMDGVVTNHQMVSGSDSSHPELLITGEDVSKVMDMINFSGFPFPAMPAEGRIALLLLKYAMFGIIPMIIPSIMIDVPIPTGNIPSQQGTDLKYIQALAAQVGYVFYIEPGPVVGVNRAYWGPRIKVGIPQPALNVDMDAHTNVESLNFTFDPNKNKLPIVYIYNEITKVVFPIPIPPITPLNPPLGLVPPFPNFGDLTPFRADLSKFSIPKAIMIGLAEASLAAEAVTGSGSLDVLRYGRILKARQLVGVRGVGPAYDGLHYVTNVKHKIKQGQYKQEFQLSRNGLISTVPKVMS
jgi:hypothetical protein